MKILVTGGSGFVGSRLVESLSQLGHEIINLDIESPKNKTNSVFLQCDITDYNQLKKVAEENLAGTEIVYHLAGMSREADSMKMPDVYYKVNVNGTFNVLDISRIIGVKKFIFASTFLVYGNPEYSPLDEGHPTNPKTIYSSSKLCGEIMCRSFQETYGMPTVCFRKSVIYGKDDPHKRIVTLFIERARDGKDLTVFGNKSLDFVYIGDVISAYVSVLGSKETGIFNIGSGEPITLMELANVTRDKINPRINIIEEGLRQGEITKFSPDISKARSLLGFNPKQDLKKFIESCI